MSETFALTAQEVVHKPASKRRAKPPAIPPATARERYTATKHCCRVCFGRVLKVIDSEPAIYRCADCGASGQGSNTSICSCATNFNTGRSMGIRCIENPDRGPVSTAIIVAAEGACS